MSKRVWVPVDRATEEEYPNRTLRNQISSNPSSLAPVSEPGTVGSGIQLATVLRFIDIAVDALAGAREEIDALNVYPVPDGDTGTNMYLTMAAARDAVREKAAAPGADRAPFEAFTRGALLGARGNSGVILSEMLRAIIRRIAEAQPGGAQRRGHGRRAAAGDRGELRRGRYAGRGHHALGLPGRGRRGRGAAVDEEPDGALARRPHHQCRCRPRGARPHARPAPGARGRRAWSTPAAVASWSSSTPPRPHSPASGRRQVEPGRPDPAAHPRQQGPAQPGADLVVDGGPAYEVMYLLDAPDDAIAGLRSTLAALGDSLVVVGGEGLWNVHVHVDDVGAAIEAGIEAGRPHRVRVTHFAEQVAARGRRGPGRSRDRRRRGRAGAGRPVRGGRRGGRARRARPPPLDRDAARGHRADRRPGGRRPAQRPRHGARPPRSRPAPPRPTTTSGSR